MKEWRHEVSGRNTFCNSSPAAARRSSSAWQRKVKKAKGCQRQVTTLMRWYAVSLVRWCADTLVPIGATCVNPNVVFDIRTVFECSTENFSHMSSKTHKKGIPWETPEWNHKQWGRIMRQYWTLHPCSPAESCRNKTRVTSNHIASSLVGEDLRIKTSHARLLLCLSLGLAYKETSQAANTSAKLRH